MTVVFQISAIEPDLQEWQGFPYPESDATFSKEVFHYSMKGSVRLLQRGFSGLGKIMLEEGGYPESTRLVVRQFQR